MLSDRQFLLLLAIGAGVAWYVKGRAASALNPASDQNLAYTGVNSLGDVLNDGERDNDFNLGRELYFLLNPGVNREQFEQSLRHRRGS